MDTFTSTPESNGVFNNLKELVALKIKAERVISQAEYLKDWKLVQRSHGSSDNVIYRSILRY